MPSILGNDFKPTIDAKIDRSDDKTSHGENDIIGEKLEIITAEIGIDIREQDLLRRASSPPSGLFISYLWVYLNLINQIES